MDTFDIVYLPDKPTNPERSTNSHKKYGSSNKAMKTTIPLRPALFSLLESIARKAHELENNLKITAAIKPDTTPTEKDAV